MLFLNDSFFVVSCFVLVVGDSFLIRSIKKFFCFVYLLARVCLGARTWACVCAYVCACMRVRVRVGVTFVQHYGVVWYLCIPVAKMTQFKEMLHIYHTFCGILRLYQLVYAIKTVT